MTKRDISLQCLRGLAIIAVVSFHLQPKKFPFGYLGVDIFFVISGYLMTMILSKESDTVTFYLRRIKRIFPIYFLIITVFFGIGYFKLLPSHFKFLKTEVLYSVFFINNFPPMFQKKEYFQMISEYKFFLHTWSLSVEIQFYFISPFLIKFILSKNRPLFWTFFFALFSWIFQTFISNNSVAFGFVFCRIWQFLVGTFAFLYSNQNYIGYVLVGDGDLNYESTANEDENIVRLENKTSSENMPTQNLDIIETKNSARQICVTFITFAFLIIICFSPFKFLSLPVSPYIFRLLITILTGIFITLNNSQRLNIPYLINAIFVYIGDISYVIYLIHWPIIIFFKYFHINYGDFFTILCIFSSTLFIHECFERPLGKLSWCWNITVIILCCVIIAVLCLVKENTILTSLNPIQLNQEEAHSCGEFYCKNSCMKNSIIEKYLKFRPKINVLDVYCSIKLNPKSNKTIVIVGNSFVYFQIRGILKAIKESKIQFSEVFVIAHPFCDLLVGKLNTDVEEPCEGIDTSLDELLNVTRPDIIIHSGRIDQLFPTHLLPTFNLKSDFYYKEIKRQILHISSFTRRLIIIEPHPPFLVDGYLNPLTIGHALLVNDSPNKFNISLQEFHKKHDPSWNRVKETVKQCKNCEIVPTQNIMCPTNLCPMVDPISQIGLFCDKYHITPRQSLKFVPELIEAINKD